MTLTEPAARELLSALDALDRLARPRGQRLSPPLAAIRRELTTCITRVHTPADASPNDVAAQLLSHSESMTIDPATAAARLGLTPDGVRWLCRHGHLTAIRHRGRWYIDHPSVETYRARRAHRTDHTCPTR